jgi:hypothetical protein
VKSRLLSRAAPKKALWPASMPVSSTQMLTPLPVSGQPSAPTAAIPQLSPSAYQAAQHRWHWFLLCHEEEPKNCDRQDLIPQVRSRCPQARCLQRNEDKVAAAAIAARPNAIKHIDRLWTLMQPRWRVAPRCATP